MTPANYTDLKIMSYRGFKLHIGYKVLNPNGRFTRTVLILENGKFVGASYADIFLENVITKAKNKIINFQNLQTL
jgi:hypothetical protein